MNYRLLCRILRNRLLLVKHSSSASKLYSNPCAVVSRSFSNQKIRQEFEEEEENEELRRKQLSDEEKLKEKLEQVRQMNEYYSQYVEEYYEEEEEGDEKEELDEEWKSKKAEEKMRASIKKNLRPVQEATPERVVELLRELRAQNIVCLQVPDNQSTHPYIIICSSQNDRHADAITQSVRKFIKLNFYYPNRKIPDKVKNTAGWYVLEIGNIILHMMTDSVRELYDLEVLHGVGGDDDHLENQHLDAEFLPPAKKL